MSTAEIVSRYLAERFPPVVFAPLTLLLSVFSALAGRRELDFLAFAQTLLVVFALLLAFRVWDDFADRGYDRVHHPDRTMLRTDGRRAWFLLIALPSIAAVGTIAATGGASPRLVVLALTTGVLAAWYRVPQQRRANRLLNAHVVLLKYPAIVVAAAPGGVGSALHVAAVLAGAAYVGVGIHELVTDREVRNAPHAKLFLAVDAAVLGAVALVALSGFARSP